MRPDMLPTENDATAAEIRVVSRFKKTEEYQKQVEEEKHVVVAERMAANYATQMAYDLGDLIVAVGDSPRHQNPTQKAAQFLMDHNPGLGPTLAWWLADRVVF